MSEFYTIDKNDEIVELTQEEIDEMFDKLNRGEIRRLVQDYNYEYGKCFLHTGNLTQRLKNE